MIKIISLSGHIGSGKDEVAKRFNEYGAYRNLKLAELPKRIVCEKEGITLKELESNRELKEKLRPQIIQVAEKIKELDLFYFCKVVHRQIEKLVENNGSTKFLISDLRWPFEANYFRQISRCTKTRCGLEYHGVCGREVEFKSLFIDSDLAHTSSKEESESYIESYFRTNNDGVITNGKVEREDESKLIEQIVKYI